MNVTANIEKIVDGLKSTPFVLTIVIINCITLSLFAYVLHEVSAATDRRDALLKACIERRT